MSLNEEYAGCECHLLPTLARLLGPDSPVVELIGENVSHIPTEWLGFNRHMAIEEALILPLLPEGQQSAILADHARFRAQYAAHHLPSGDDMRRHASLEREWYGKAGIIHPR